MIEGRRNGRLVAVKVMGRRMYGGQVRVFWLVRCNCGAEFELASSSFADKPGCTKCLRQIGGAKSAETRRGTKRTVETRTKMSLARKAYYKRIGGYPEEQRAKQRVMKGDMLYNWKGDAAGYGALHSWVKRWLGKPDTCEHCKKAGLKGVHIHWANRSGEYLRELGDWIRLCARCHRIFDVEKGLGRVKEWRTKIQ